MIKQTLILLVLTVSFYAGAQPYKTIKPFKPYKWMFGVHWNAVDDDGHKFDQIFDVNNSWNIKPFPTSLTIDRYFVYGWSAELALNYAEYTTNKLIYDTTGISGFNLSADIHGKYSFYNNYAPKARWIDPYLIAGIGFTYRQGVGDAYVPTVNLGGGVNFWIVNQLGIRLSATSKFGAYPAFWDTHNNYLQYNAGIVFRTPDNAVYKNPNRKKQHKWTNSQPKKYKEKGGH